MNPAPLAPLPSDTARLTQEALALAPAQPRTAYDRLHTAATEWLAQGQPRSAAFVLHQSAALALELQQSPIVDLAAAAQLLGPTTDPDARAVVLLDLGIALHQAKDPRRARLALRESYQLAVRTGQSHLASQSQEALTALTAQRMGIKDLETTLRSHAILLAQAVERDLRTALEQIGTLTTAPPTPVTVEGLLRQQDVENELSALKKELGMA